METKKLVEEIASHNGYLCDLLRVLEQETGEMAGIRIDAMAVSNQEKNSLIARITEHSGHLQRLVAEMAAREHLPGSTTLGSLAEYGSKRGDKEIVMAQQQLCKTAEQVQQRAALNCEIAERFVSTVTTSLGLIARVINQSNVYGSSGGYQQRPADAVMINREA